MSHLIFKLIKILFISLSFKATTLRRIVKNRKKYIIMLFNLSGREITKLLSLTILLMQLSIAVNIMNFDGLLLIAVSEFNLDCPCASNYPCVGT